MTHLQQLFHKRALGVKLTGAENRLWEAHLRHSLLKQRERITADRDGNVTITKTMDAEPIVEGVKMMSDSQLHSPYRRDDGRLYLGSIDEITARNWAKECGHPLYSKEWKEYSRKKLMSGDFAKFRADRVRKLV